MRKSLVGLLAGCLALAFLLGPDFVAHATPVPNGDQPGVGTYYGVFDLGGGFFLPFVGNASRDGTLTTVDGTDAGLGDVSNSTSVGRWSRTGHTQITSQTMYLGYDPVTSLPITVTRATGVADFDSARLESGTGVNTTRTYDLTLGEDPLDPDGGTITGVFPFTVQMVY